MSLLPSARSPRLYARRMEKARLTEVMKSRSSPPPRPSPKGEGALSSSDFEESGSTLPAPDAHRHDHVLHAPALAFDQRMPDQPRAGDAVRMADRDRAAVHVERIVGDAELVAAIDHLDRE